MELGHGFHYFRILVKNTSISFVLIKKFLSAVFLLLTFLSYGQKFQFTNYSLLQGLPQSQVYCLHEDVDGFIWMGTRGGGVTRFDGITFQTFTTKDSLAGNYINAIESYDDKIWVATNSGLSMYSSKQWTSIPFFTGKAIQDVLIVDEVLWAVAEGELYFTSPYKPLLLEKAVGFPSNIKSIQKSDNGVLWGIASSEVFYYKDGLEILNVDYPLECISSQNNQVWLGTHGHGLFKKDASNFMEYGHLMGIENEIIYNVYQAGEDLWISTLQKGLFQFNTLDSSFSNFKEINGLANNHVRVSLKDSWGNLWVGTGGSGVSKYSGQTFEKWFTSNGLKGNYIYAVCEDFKATKWIGTSGGGVTLIDSNVRYLNGENGFLNNKTKAIFQAHDSAIWLGTDGGGLTVVTDDTIRKFNTKNGLQSDWIKSFTEDSEGNIWVATYGGGISQFTKTTDSTYSIQNYSKRKRELISDHIIDIAVDWKGRVWYAAPGKGLGFKDGNTFSRSTVKGLNRENLRSLEIDSNYLYVASTKGINIIDLHSDSIYAQELDNPYQLASENIYALQLDLDGNLWVGTEKGLDRLKLDEKRVLEIEHFDASNGFTGVETTSNASMVDKDENIWFGSIDGLFKYNKQDANENTVPPKTSWTEIKIGKQTVAKLTQTHLQIDPWLLPFGNNRISFDFKGVSHSAPGKVTYIWKLDGRDDQFTEPTQNHFVEYGSLPPGDYNFLVYALNENGISSTKPLSFAFTVATPFWMFPSFIILASAIVLLVFYLIYRNRIKVIQRKSKEREEKLKLENSLISLEQKALQLQMNPHFIFHTLNSIQELVATKEEKTARQYLTKFSKLMRQILDGSRTNTIALSEEIKMLENYLTLEKFSHEDRFDFEIICESEEFEFISIPSMIIQPFVENALIHGALKAEGVGKVSIEFRVFEKEVQCVIVDNGPGLGENTSDHKSSAIEITKERLRMLSGKENSVEIKNRKMNGVEVIVHLPIIEENETV